MKNYIRLFSWLLILNILVFLSDVKPFEHIPRSKPTPVEQFMDEIAEIESEGKYHVVNRYGMLGRYQFSPSTIRSLGFRINKDKFLRSKHIQDTVMLVYMIENERELAPLISRYEGRIIKGVKINRASILAGAHFVGSHNMRRFLTDPSNGGVTDGNGTTLVHYMSKFSRFHLPPLKI